MHHDPEHHDNRYEDGDPVEGYGAEWDAWEHALRTFEVRLWLNTWQGREIPPSYLGGKRFIRAATSGDAARIAGERWPHAWRIATKEVTPC
jgi:hypothetical protein